MKKDEEAEYTVRLESKAQTQNYTEAVETLKQTKQPLTHDKKVYLKT